MKSFFAIVLSSLAVGAQALTLHRSFRPTAIGTGGGTSVIAPGFAQRTGSQFLPSKTPPKKVLIGTVTQVADGDTIWVTPKGGSKTKVQLLGIDAPEDDQPYGVEVKKFLSDLILNKTVEVQYTTKDRKGCVGGVAFLKHEQGVVDVNLTMVRNGLAWHSKSANNTDAYFTGEVKARAEKRGLWADEAPIDPAKWAKGMRGAK